MAASWLVVQGHAWTGNEHGQYAGACANVQYRTTPVNFQSGSNCSFDGCSILSIARAIIQHGEVPTVQHLSIQPVDHRTIKKRLHQTQILMQ